MWALSKELINPKTGNTYPHVMAGDFNTTSWMQTFNEWCQEDGIWHLNDPAISTINTGSSIAKFLFTPGNYIPSTFLSNYMEDNILGTEEAAPYFPAKVIPELALADHYSLILPIPCDVHEHTFTNNKLDLTELSPQDWEDENQEIGQTLSNWKDTLHQLAETQNVEHFYNKLEASIKKTLANQLIM